MAVGHHGPSVEPLLAEPEDEALRRVTLFAALENGRYAYVVEVGGIKLPRNDISPVAHEIDGVCAGFERDLLPPCLHGSRAVALARKHPGPGVAARILPYVRHKLDFAIRERRHLAAPRDIPVSPRGDRPDVLDKRRGADIDRRRRVEQISVLAVIVTPGIDDARFSRAVAAVRDEYPDLVRLSEIEERSKLDRAIRMKRDAGLLPVHEDDRVAPVELLLVSDAAPAPCRGHVERTPEPACIGSLLVVPSRFALRAIWFPGQLPALLPCIKAEAGRYVDFVRIDRLLDSGVFLRRNDSGSVGYTLCGNRLLEPAVCNINRDERPCGSGHGEDKN